MSKSVLHQITVGAAPGDAITDQALLLRRWLREMGFVSELYAEHIHPALEKEVKPVAAYRPRDDAKWVVYHHSIGTPVVEQLVSGAQRMILIYHNVTPPQFFQEIDPALARQMAEGRDQLDLLRSCTDLALADSPYNQADLMAAGFEHTNVLPIALDETAYDLPSNPALLDAFAQSGPLLLFVSRLVPNKKQDDLLKLLYYYRRIEPAARLLIVGEGWVPAYARWLQDLAAALALEDAVILTGHVTQQDLVTYYRLADLYVSMSEHEGFGKPLIESMALDLPVLAYAAASVPGTLGGAGVLFTEKCYEAVAELVNMLVQNECLRRRVVARQRQRVQFFLEPTIRHRWRTFLESIYEPDIIESDAG